MLVPGTLVVGIGKFLINKKHTCGCLFRLSSYNNCNWKTNAKEKETFVIVFVTKWWRRLDNCPNPRKLHKRLLLKSWLFKTVHNWNIKYEMFAVFDLLASYAHYSAEFHFTTWTFYAKETKTPIIRGNCWRKSTKKAYKQNTTR